MIIATDDFVKVINYLKLQKIDAESIAIKMAHYLLTIKGRNLVVVFYEKNELHIQGKIEEIHYGTFQ